MNLIGFFTELGEGWHSDKELIARVGKVKQHYVFDPEHRFSLSTMPEFDEEMLEGLSDDAKNDYFKNDMTEATVIALITEHPITLESDRDKLKDLLNLYKLEIITCGSNPYDNLSQFDVTYQSVPLHTGDFHQDVTAFIKSQMSHQKDFVVTR